MAEAVYPTKAQLERRVENIGERREKMARMTLGFVGGGLAGFASGYLLAKFPALKGFGPGDKINLFHLYGLAGFFLGRRRSKVGKLAFGAGCYGAGKVAEPYGQDFALPSGDS